MKGIKFESERHEKKFYELIKRLPKRHLTREGYCLAYLLALIGRCENDLFDFKEGLIKPDGLREGWQTSSTVKTTKLMFALWNGCFYNEEDANIYNIFGYSEWDKYYIEAIRIRFETAY